MNSIQSRVESLRAIMKREGLSAYIISGTDPHNSEYLPMRWQQRKWISGFTGSYGTVVVTLNDAGLWTDTRYFIQSTAELAGSGISLHKLRVPEAVNYPEWLASTLQKGDCVGFDGYCMAVGDVKALESALSKNGITARACSDLIGELWCDRPEVPMNPLFILPTAYAGVSATDKLAAIRTAIAAKGCDAIFLSVLDEIAWLLNVRCEDIAFTPTPISYLWVNNSEAHLFITKGKVSAEVEAELNKEAIYIHGYDEIVDYLSTNAAASRRCWVDEESCNFALYSLLASKIDIYAAESPAQLMKAIKNPREIEGFKMANVKDGVALSRFFYWLENHIGKEEISELDAAARLTAFRAELEECVGDSFHYISAYGQNAALPHYFPTEAKQSYLQPKGLYLIDSGGHYLHGTTDITRTVPLGPINDLEREDYTYDLKAMIGLATAIFPKGTHGCNLDLATRMPLFKAFRNYGHGTGHGIGYYLSVHEGPQAIRMELKNQPVMPGMVMSDEPGIYREGEHGVRHENMILCIPLTSNQFGEFYGFETLTRCYIDTAPLKKELLTAFEVDWLNRFHEDVYREVSPYLEKEVAEWLFNKTRPI